MTWEKYRTLNDIPGWGSCSGVPRGCVNRICLWPFRHDDHSDVVIGAGGMRRSDWPARMSCKDKWQLGPTHTCWTILYLCKGIVTLVNPKRRYYTFLFSITFSSCTVVKPDLCNLLCWEIVHLLTGEISTGFPPLISPMGWATPWVRHVHTVSMTNDLSFIT